MTEKEAVEKFKNYAQQYDKTAPNHHWYVGITNDPDRRKGEHECEKGIKCEHFAVLLTSTNRDAARKVEGLVKNAGFAIDKNDLDPIIANDSVNESEEKISIYIYLAVEAKANNK